MSGLQLYRRLLTYAWKYRTALIVALLFMPIASAGELGIAYITKLMVDEGIVLKNPQIMVIAPVGMVLVILIRGMATFQGSFVSGL